MPAAQKHAAAAARGAAPATSLEALDAVSAAVESGAGLPAVARAAGAALGASVIVVDAASSVLAVACASPDDERAVLSADAGTEVAELRVADSQVGQLRFRPRATPAPPALLRMVTALIALEVERSRAPERASEAAIGDFLADLLGRRSADRADVVARGKELGADLGVGGSVVVVRARPQQPERGDWRARVLMVAERGARGVERTALAAMVESLGPRAEPGGDASEPRRPARPERELVILIPGGDAEHARRAAQLVLTELETTMPSYLFVVARSRTVADPADLHRAGAEALLAANVAEARGATTISFEETGAYRLLLPAISEDPAELERFYAETVAPLADYDEQYETELVRTVDSFLEADGNVARTAERLYTHRHTIRYRLDRARELSGLDVGSTDGRERLSLGLKAMRVLGIPPPGGPASERGTEAGRVPREEKDR